MLDLSHADRPAITVRQIFGLSLFSVAVASLLSSLFIPRTIEQHLHEVSINLHGINLAPQTTIISIILIIGLFFFSRHNRLCCLSASAFVRSPAASHFPVFCSTGHDTVVPKATPPATSLTGHYVVFFAHFRSSSRGLMPLMCSIRSSIVDQNLENQHSTGFYGIQRLGSKTSVFSEGSG